MLVPAGGFSALRPTLGSSQGGGEGIEPTEKIRAVFTRVEPLRRTLEMSRALTEKHGKYGRLVILGRETSRI